MKNWNQKCNCLRVRTLNCKKILNDQEELERLATELEEGVHGFRIYITHRLKGVDGHNGEPYDHDDDHDDHDADASVETNSLSKDAQLKYDNDPWFHQEEDKTRAMESFDSHSNLLEDGLVKRTTTSEESSASQGNYAGLVEATSHCHSTPDGGDPDDGEPDGAEPNEEVEKH